MSVLSGLDPTDRQVLRVKLESLVGVERALVEGEMGAIWILCEPGRERMPVVPLKAAARDAISALDIDPAAVTIEVAARVDRVPRRRVRLGPVERSDRESEQVGVRVELEWRSDSYIGEAVGTRGGPTELRTAARATLDALRPLMDDRLRLRLIGIKRFRKFDEELVAVSLSRTDVRGHRYVGTVLVSSDPLRTSAMAVLNALNRVLGNILATA